MSGPPSADFRFSTAGRSARDAFDEYQSIFSAGAETARHRPDFHATFAGYQLTRMVVQHRRLAGIRHLRPAALVRRTDFSHFTLTLCVAGSIAAAIDGDERRLVPGEIILSDMTRPGLIQIDRAETITVSVAREIVEAAGGEPRRFSGRVLPRERAAALARYLEGLTRPVPADAPAWLPEEETAARLRAALAPDATDSARRTRARRLLAAHRIIDARLADHQFGSPQLAEALQVSRATLYRLFEPLGGVAAHILDRRLTLLRRLLADNGRATSVASLVASVGLVSESHASRAFLQRFDARPGRFAALSGEMTDAQRAARAMALLPRLLA